MEWSLGQLVCSKQGRDRGTHYVIIKTEAKCCFVADGRNFTISALKKKNYKHLQGTLTCSPKISEQLAQGLNPTDAEIRDFLNHHGPKSGILEE